MIKVTRKNVTNFLIDWSEVLIAIAIILLGSFSRGDEFDDLITEHINRLRACEVSREILPPQIADRICEEGISKEEMINRMKLGLKAYEEYGRALGWEPKGETK